MGTEIYATPKSDSIELNLDDNTPKILMYSPAQVMLGVIGGPVGLIYFLWSNFDALGNQSAKNKIWYSGFLLMVVIVLLNPFLPENMPSSVFTAAYGGTAWYFSTKYQMTRQAIITSPAHDFHSNWRVVGFTLLCLVMSALILFSLGFLWMTFGYGS